MSQRLISLWLQAGGAQLALLHIRHSLHAASSSSHTTPPTPSPWGILDDAELFSAARLCLSKVCIIMHLNPLAHPPAHHIPLFYKVFYLLTFGAFSWVQMSVAIPSRNLRRLPSKEQNVVGKEMESLTAAAANPPHV
jgi:hypothetical protein